MNYNKMIYNKNIHAPQFELINSYLLINSGFLLERERDAGVLSPLLLKNFLFLNKNSFNISLTFFTNIARKLAILGNISLHILNVRFAFTPKASLYYYENSY